MATEYDSFRPKMSDIERELGTQPECWRQVTERRAELSEGLPAQGERVVATGCGSSYFVALAFAALREARGHGETDAFPASEMPPGRRYDRVIAISRSGLTTEVLRVIEGLPPETPTVVVTAARETQLARTARKTVVLDFADERSVVQTRFATTVLALLRAHLGDDVDRAAADAEGALAGELPIDPRRFDHFVFLGTGWTVGLANEAALKLRETGGAWAEGWPAMEYRHGPISVAGERSAVWALGEVDGALLDDVRRTGATAVANGLDPMADLVLAQRLGVTLAKSRGLDPDRPRHLSRSVVLSE